MFAYPENIHNMLVSWSTTYKELDTTIDRLNHVGYLIPTACHFLSHIRRLKYTSKFKRHRTIPRLALANLHLWMNFLSQAHKGISMNLITYRTPIHVYRSDACEHGLGVYSSTGKAWRWIIPTHLLSRSHINLLGFLASIVCIWLDYLDNDIPPESCLLSMVDSTTSSGWLQKSNFQDEDETDTEQTAKFLAARQLATTIMGSKSCLYSQWFPGDDNDVSDSLSRYIDLSDEKLIKSLNLNVSSQLPPNFRMVPLKSEIVSWLC